MSEKTIEEQIAEAVEAATKGLKAKNDELLGEVKQLRKSSTITPEKLAQVEEERDALKDQLAEANRTVTKAQKDAKAATDALSAEKAASHSLLVDRGMTDALMKAGVKKEYVDFVKAKYMQQAKVIEADGARKGTIGDKDIETFFAEWAKGDEAKHFIAAPVNNGGGAPGGGGANANQKTATRAQFDAMGQHERMTFSKEGGKVTE